MRHFVKQSLAGILLLLALWAAAQAGVTPSRLNYQGLLTDANGQPLNTDGILITFRIWSHPTSTDPADLKWQEQQTFRVVDGLFNVILGDIFEINDTVFASSNSFLGIQIDGDVEGFPRTRLVSVGYSTRVETLDGARGGVISGPVTLQPPTAKDNDSTTQLRYELVDESQVTRFWASAQEVFTPCVEFAGDSTRQCTAAFNSGAAQFEDAATFTTIGNTKTILAQQSITCPTDGFVLVIGSCQADVAHSGGGNSTAEFGVSNQPNMLDSDQEKEWTIAGIQASATYRNVISAQKVFPVTAGTSTFYLLGRRIEGSSSFKAYNKTLSLIFVPTAYGSVSGSTMLQTAADPQSAAIAARPVTVSAPSEIEQLRAEVAELRRLLETDAQNGAKQ